MLTKKKIHSTIDKLAEPLSIDEVISELILLDKIEQGINDANEGRVFTTEEAKEKLNKWLK